MKKLIYLLLSGLFLCGFVACGNTADSEIPPQSTSEAGNITTEAMQTTTEVPHSTTKAPHSTTVTEAPITTAKAVTTPPVTTEAPLPAEAVIDASFVIVLPSDATESERMAADKLVTAMVHLGVTLPIQDDTAPKAKNEILVGQTSREASKTALQTISEGGFSLTVDGMPQSGITLTLAAADAIGMELAAKYLTFTYFSTDGKATLPLDLAVTHKRGEATVSGTPLSSYVVVYAKEGVMSDADIQAAKYKDTAALFASYVEKVTGKTLTIVPDGSDLSRYDHIIYFGNHSGSEDNSLYNTKLLSRGAKVYAAKILNKTRIGLAGNNAVSALAAGEAFLCRLMAHQNTLDKLDLFGTKDIIHVACIGDSITYGTGSDDPSLYSYPVYYQRMLGYDYYVEKYGAPSHSLIETDDPSFLSHQYLKKSARSAPDVVIVMLGTNDCRPQKWADSAYKNWNDASRKEAFISSGQKLIDTYRAKNPDVQIMFATCPTVPQDKTLGTDWTFRIIRYGNPSIKQLAKSNNCPVIDIYTFTAKNPDMFEGGDGLHLKNEKYQDLAQGFYDLTKDIIKK